MTLKKTAKKQKAKKPAGKNVPAAPVLVYNPGKELPDSDRYYTVVLGDSDTFTEHQSRSGAIEYANDYARRHGETVHVLIPALKVKTLPPPDEAPVVWMKA